MEPDLYKVLQVQPDADQEVIEAAYRRLAQKIHPDLNPSPDASERMKALNRAYEVLCDPGSRRRYDAKNQSVASGPSAHNEPPKESKGTASTRVAQPQEKKHEQQQVHAKPVETEMSVCQSCGRAVPTLSVTLYQNIGAIVVRFHKKVSGELCRSCIFQYFWDFTLKTAIVGWWGVISFIVTPLILLNNTYYFVRSLGLASSYVASKSNDSQNRAWSPTLGILALIVAASLVIGGIMQAIGEPNRAAPLIAYQPTPSAFLQPTQAPVPNTSVPQPTAYVYAYVAPSPALRETPTNVGPKFLPTRLTIPGYKEGEAQLGICVPVANVRSGPSTDSSILGQMTSNQVAHAYGYVGEWWYLGTLVSQPHFLHESTVCKAARTGAPASTEITNANNSFIPLPEQDIPICVTWAMIHEGPEVDSEIVDRIQKDSLWPVSGRVGDWFYGIATYRDSYRKGYIARSDFCIDPGIPRKCDDYLYQKWKNGKSEIFAPPCLKR